MVTLSLALGVKYRPISKRQGLSFSICALSGSKTILKSEGNLSRSLPAAFFFQVLLKKFGKEDCFSFKLANSGLPMVTLSLALGVKYRPISKRQGSSFSICALSGSSTIS